MDLREEGSIESPLLASSSLSSEEWDIPGAMIMPPKGEARSRLLAYPSDVSMVSSSTEWEMVSPATKNRGVLLGCGCAVMLIQWALMMMCTSYFPTSAPGQALSPFSQGLVFSAFPLGSSLGAPFVGDVMQRIGTKWTLITGLSCMSTFAVLFGVVPRFASGSAAPYLGELLGATAFLYGFTSALAEVGTVSMLASAYPDKMGTDNSQQ
jgi:hypothetical protein